MSKPTFWAALLAVSLGVGAVIIGMVTDGQGFYPDGVLTIPQPEDFLIDKGMEYSKVRSESGILQVSTGTVIDRLLAGLPITLIDIRSPEEFAKLHIKGSTLLPLENLLSMGGMIDTPPGEMVVVVCNRGFASMEGMIFLRMAGIPAYSMKRGIRDIQEDITNPQGVPSTSPLSDTRFDDKLGDIAALLEGGGSSDYVPPPPKKRQKRETATMGEGC